MFPAARWARVAAVVVLTAGATAAPTARAGETEAKTSDAARAARVVQPTTDFSRAEAFETMQGGAATSTKMVNADSFSHFAANMPFAREIDFKVGNGFFRRLWVSAPASTRSSDGLGPLFNARSCQRCHLKDGRGHPPKANWPDDSAVSMFLRLSIPPQTEAERKALADHRLSVVPEPTYGTQLQDFAIQGIAPEGRMHITYSEETVTLADGTTVSLRRPVYTVTDLGYGPLHPDVMISPRVANPMIGLGLLEMIDEADIRAGADPEDRDGDGISGRVQVTWDREAGRAVLGRFGWKAGEPTVRQQSAHAFSGDIGISTPPAPAHWGDCTAAQTACRTAPDGGTTPDAANPTADGMEASEKVLSLVSFYAQNLAVPQRRDVDAPQVLAGKKVFYESGCTSCHRPKFVTRRDPAQKEKSFQLIWPYSDMLLHDMGEGLADHRPEGLANGREWRTPPLWGIGLTKTVSGHTFFLHDGRARNLLEAILWHGGEAAAARDTVKTMTTKDREALLAFLNSL
ncbi:MAG TPA: thiol oxidoreductase [Rhodospirillaceae bacterium]|nr:thiol oxidoreductase [Rhodospirillaceae bacterium]